MTEQGEEHIMRKLYQQYKPRVFHIVSDKCYEYRNDTVVQPEPKCKGMMEIFVPVLIINVPPKGNLDISKVLDSPYFFHNICYMYLVNQNISTFIIYLFICYLSYSLVY